MKEERDTDTVWRNLIISEHRKWNQRGRQEMGGCHGVENKGKKALWKEWLRGPMLRRSLEHEG